MSAPDLRPFDFERDDGERILGARLAAETEQWLATNSQPRTVPGATVRRRRRAGVPVGPDARPVDLRAWHLLTGAYIGIASLTAFGVWLGVGVVVWLRERRAR